jgi:hypothetical protein
MSIRRSPARQEFFVLHQGVGGVQSDFEVV